MLADKVEIGDYVNYPVYYDNVNGSTLKGWRVISKNIDLDGNPSPGTVNLVSAGVPLMFNQLGDPDTSAEVLTNNFLETPISPTENHCYTKNGFIPFLTLKQVFENNFTLISGDKLQVRAMKVKDIMHITGGEKNTEYKKWNKLFNVGSEYMLANAKASYYVYLIDTSGRFHDNGYAYYMIGIRPVVSLKSNLKTSGFNLDTIWNIQL